MPRRPTNPELGAMVVVSARFHSHHVSLLDVIASGLGAAEGQRPSRGEALRTLVVPVLDAALEHADVAKAVKKARDRAIELATSSGDRLERAASALSIPLPEAKKIFDALGGIEAVRAGARRAVKHRGPREEGPEPGPPPHEPEASQRTHRPRKRKSRS